ncbi:MAG: leucine-rich repeat domain-containing protein [Lachnospiraceae bacterium]|nr:leucine-rich repeat domain-containing protein [Lachnospiraceae bacterium]
MKKAVKWITVIAILSAAVLLVALKLIDESNKVDFADEYIGIRIMADGLYHKSKEENLEGLMYEDFRKDDLKYVTSLEIFNTIRTETLVDLEKCPNLESLEIADTYGKLVSWYGEDWAVWEYEKDCGKLPSVPGAEKIKQFEAELEGVLQECKQLKRLCIYNWGDTFNLDSVQFLIYGENLTRLSLYYLGDIDYSPVLECTNLEVLYLSNSAISDLGQISRLENLRILWLDSTDIKEAGDIVNLKNLETLYIMGTPLAENEEELQILREALPGLKIITEDP